MMPGTLQTTRTTHNAPSTPSISIPQAFSLRPIYRSQSSGQRSTIPPPQWPNSSAPFAYGHNGYNGQIWYFMLFYVIFSPPFSFSVSLFIL